MSKGNDKKPYRIIGAYDSETANVISDNSKSSYPILHQIGILDCPIEQVHSSDVVDHTDVHFYRHSLDAYAALDDIAAREYPYVPVICCHNLSFDMWGLSQWLSGHDVKVLAKSRQKPISFTVLGEDGKTPRLVIWDTLGFAAKSLEYMGRECGYPKMVGDWDYNLVRTPETPLTEEEEGYAAHDIYVILAWLGYWCRLNPDIEPSMLGLRVVTKTGIVRQRRLSRFANLKGKGLSRTVGQYWMMTNRANAFETNDELFSCNAATRGGLTFCSSVNASVPFDFPADSPYRVYGFDATSQHPSQMVTHKYPSGFTKATPKSLELDFSIVSHRSIDWLLEHYDKPFKYAFYACFEFKNLRIKEGSIFEKWGIAPLAWARCDEYAHDEERAEENQQVEEFREQLAKTGYKDQVENPIYSFGKLESATKARLWITELAAWEICQAYDFDSVKAISGYDTGRFFAATDMSIISVMQFYGAKNAFKHAKRCYEDNAPIDNVDELRGYHIPEFVIEGMVYHEIEDKTVDATYLGLKADLNSLFGIEACNEYRRDTELGDDGIEYVGEFGVCNKPKTPKAFYQYGQRIVGWSRIAQIIVMELAAPYIETVINGDTDSIKMVIRNDCVSKVNDALERMNKAIDKAKERMCERVKRCYPQMYDSLDGIGYYILEFETRRFCASWNKAYCIGSTDIDGNEHVSFTLAGIPVKYRSSEGLGINALADKLLSEGMPFEKLCDIFLGYNVAYSHGIIGLNARSFPSWGDLWTGRIVDYRGSPAMVCEPCSLALYPMGKVVNDTGNKDNLANMRRAVKNRPSVNRDSIVITNEGITRL